MGSDAALYDGLLPQFRNLAIQVDPRLFDLRWHSVSDGTLQRHTLLPDGGWSDVEWPGVSPAHAPFSAEQREVVGQLCMPLDESGEVYTLGFDPVTVPKSPSLVQVTSTFKQLAAQAGLGLPPLIRERLREYVPVICKAPANWWYAFLFWRSRLVAARADGDSVVYERELIVWRPLLLSIDEIQRLLQIEAELASGKTGAEADDSGWVAFGKVWPEKFKTYKQAKAFLEAHPKIHTRKPSKQRLEVRAGDWTKYWLSQDRKAFDALGKGEEPKPITPELTTGFVAGAQERYKAILAKKAAGKGGK